MMTLIPILLIVFWEAYWTYKACWLAAKQDQKKWFLFFLIFNLLGIPEILFLWHNKRKSTELIENDRLN